MNGFREKIKDFGHRLSAIIVTEEAVGHGRVLIMPQREKKLKHGTRGRTMRLIDADNIYNVGNFVILDEDGNAYVSLADLCKIIDIQPTAYDVDKVVEELEGAMWLTTNDDGKTNKLSIQVVSFDDAIEIIKAGSKDE
jgi:hypothetical protein